MKVSAMKTLVCATALIVCAGCGGTQQTTYADDAAYEADMKHYRAQMAETDRQLAEANRLLLKDAEQAARFDTLLERWEQQSLRQDAILAEQERRLKLAE